MAINVPMIYTAPYVMFFMRADLLRGQVGGSWALEIVTFLGSVKWHRAIRRVPFWALSRIFHMQGTCDAHTVKRRKETIKQTRIHENDYRPLSTNHLALSV
jgi:hypothetical protein